MKKVGFLLILILFGMKTQSQILSSKGRFSIEANQGCVPFEVNITELDDFGNITRQYFYFDDVTLTNQKKFTYTESGVYQIVQIVSADNIEKTDTLQIQVFEAQKPELSFERCSNFSIFITNEDTTYDSVRIYFPSMDSVTIASGAEYQQSFTTTGEQTLQYKGIFNNTPVNCSEFEEIVFVSDELDNPDILSAQIKEVCLNEFELVLELGQYEDDLNYRVVIEETASTILFEGQLTSNSLTIGDIPYNENDYCIEVYAIDPCNPENQTGTKICNTALNLQTAIIDSLFSTYTDSGVYISLPIIEFGSFNISRKNSLEEVFQLISDTQGPYLDRIRNFSRKYSYQIEYIACDEIVDSKTTSPSFINLADQGQNSYTVSYSTASNFSNTGIVILQANDSIIENGTKRIVGNQTDYEFEIQLSSNYGIPTQTISASTFDLSGKLINRSNQIRIRYEFDIFVPKAFTPNDDGLNDRLDFFGLPSQEAVYLIYNRLGQQVAKGEVQDGGWDGKISGNIAEEGTYLYEVRFETITGEQLNKRGTFVLLRK